jgi:hypothetical protein
MRSAAWTLTAVAISGCAARGPAPAPSGEAGPTRIEIPPAAAASAGAETSPLDAVPTLPVVHEPASVACRIVEKQWSLSNLLIRQGGPAFASVTNAPVTLVMPAGAPAAPTAVFDDGQLIVRGFAREADVTMRAARAHALAGIVVPKPSAVLTWLGGAVGSLEVGVDASELLVSPELVADHMPCERVGLNAAGYSARELVTPRKNLPEREVTRAGAELSVERESTASARLRQGVTVEVVEVRGLHTRILVDSQSFVLFGWVASADLGPRRSGTGYGIGLGRLGSRSSSARGNRKCVRDLTLVAEVGGERAKVGVIRKATLFSSLEPPAAPPGADPPGRRERMALVQVSVPQARWLKLADDAKILVPLSELSDCDSP